jgi:hypothetical protein
VTTASVPPGPDAAITPAEAAALIGASERWVRDQIRDRKVPHQRYGSATHGRIALLPEHVAALRELATVPSERPVRARPLPAAQLVALGATARSRAAHRRPA